MNNIKNGYVSKYLSDAFLFIRTLVYKVSGLADATNDELIRLYGESAVDPDRPATWKYYLNISGQYHPTDEVMTVVSIDTLQEIVFSLENLKTHTATAEAYQHGTREYYTLVSRYPQQERLILGILLPANLQTAIDAEEGKILAYREDLIETNEMTIIEDLETAIKRMLFRWYNVQFNISSPLYLATILSQLHVLLLPKFLNMRLNRCHTSEVHSFHVRMFLASHGELDRFLPYLTLEQSLWLYRNIRYLERNAGRNVQFKNLIEKLLTKRRIAIGGYSIRQTDNFTDYTPKTVARLTPLNPRVNSFLDEVQELTEVYERELSTAPGNVNFLKFKEDTMTKTLQRGPSTALQTKVLHSSMSDLTNAVPETFENVAIRQWCSMSVAGDYDAFVTFNDPKSSITYSLKAVDAFIYMYYASLRADGLTIDRLPDFLNIRQRVNPKPTVQDLLQIVDTEQHNLRAYAETLVAGQPALRPCHSVSAFNTLVTAIYDECYRHWFIISSTEDYYERAMVENMTHRLFEDKRVTLPITSASMTEWLFEKNLPAYTYDRAEALALISNIYRAALGLKLNTQVKLSNVQKALLGLMEELSSYSIQFTREINETDLILVNWPAVRAGNLSQAQEDTRELETETLLMSSFGEGASRCEDYQYGEYALVDVQPSVAILSVETDVVPEQSISFGSEQHSDDTATPLFFDLTYDGQDNAIDEKHGVIGYSLLNHLTETQLSTLKSIYQ